MVETKFKANLLLIVITGVVFSRFQTQTLLFMQVTSSHSSGKMIESLLMILTLSPITPWTLIFLISSGLRKTKWTSDIRRRAFRVLAWSSTRQAMASVEAELGGTWLLTFPCQSSQRSPAPWTSPGIHLMSNIAILSCPVWSQTFVFWIQDLSKKGPSQRYKTPS